ncbi:tonB-system energizer ExbB [Martelella alba]|uniref:Biopolymer transport protein ExbB n=1 Tax=Martelella alba TaxID=2590451 RepID=A0ABY2SHP2_9HYPH|nr:tonB-system energizer ExbB [Martelella alba]TKI04865.1 tonB-system energizer ExbB [Martelella alba]
MAMSLGAYAAPSSQAAMTGPATASQSSVAADDGPALQNTAADQPADETPRPVATSDARAAAAMAAQQQFVQMDLSVLGMYRHADVVVKTVMIGLLLASIITWGLFFGKSVELSSAKRRLRREQAALVKARSLDDAMAAAEGFSANSINGAILTEMQDELMLSAEAADSAGIKERAAFRLERRVAAAGRAMGKGNGFLATIGAISPFIGLFGTVWGIMNSFIGIAHTQTTNLAVVAPGIAEALLATAIGLFAAIPAVVIYNVFVRGIAGYKAMVGDSAAHILLLLGRDLDLAAVGGRERSSVARFRVR